MENRIRHWRRERGLSQEALGKLVGLGKPTISKLERGDLRLRDVTIAKLVDALEVPAHDLLGDYASGMTPAGEAPDSTPGEDPIETAETDFGFQRVAMADKAGMVAEVFASVAPKYDLMNDLMSVGIHRLWKAEMIAWLKPRGAVRIADVAGGTGDIAFRILERAADAHVSVCDINPAMLAVGRDRALDRGILDNIDWLCGDAEALPLADGSVDAVTIAFGIRNVTCLDAALTEARRVLRPGGRFLCLEFSHVALPALEPLYDAYSFKLLPLLGEIVANDRESYQYLVESIRQFPDQETFKTMITDAGLGQCRYRNLSGGVAALHSAWRI
jgi:demethylmenaquinone methyltransferase/2-methoxy-6-polyprenyl-1,4-benzoquinol methylase